MPKTWTRTRPGALRRSNSRSEWAGRAARSSRARAEHERDRRTGLGRTKRGGHATAMPRPRAHRRPPGAAAPHHAVCRRGQSASRRCSGNRSRKGRQPVSAPNREYSKRQPQAFPRRLGSSTGGEPRHRNAKPRPVAGRRSTPGPRSRSPTLATLDEPSGDIASRTFPPTIRHGTRFRRRRFQTGYPHRQTGAATGITPRLHSRDAYVRTPGEADGC